MYDGGNEDEVGAGAGPVLMVLLLLLRTLLSQGGE